jgi:perosamine synthetase
VIPVNEPVLDGNEKKYLQECIDTGWISSEGPFVERFEQIFASRVGRRHAVAVSSGTAALDISVEALGIGPGDEVILPTFTIISCIQQIIRAGAMPVLVDSDPVSWNMDVEQVAAKITPRTKAIMAVHIYGLPVDLEPLLALANRHRLKLIEDASQMLGQTYKAKPCGSFGDISTFSFYPNKHVTTGEGGMVVTDDDGLADQARSLRNLCFQPGKRFVHERLGWNYRMTNIQAALGLAQLERLDEFVARKRAMGRLYHTLLQDFPYIQLPLRQTEFAENIYWVLGLVLDNSLAIDASAAMQKLAHKGVGTRPFFWPMHCQPVLRNKGWFEHENYPVAENLATRGFYIPSGLALNENQIIYVANQVKDILNEL